MQTFGRWLLERRKAAGLTQGQLATKAGISTSYVSTLEREQPHSVTNAAPQPASDVVESLAKALGANVDEARLAAGYSAISSGISEAERLANTLLRDIMTAGLTDLEDEDLRRAFLEDIRSIAESMLKRRLEEQEKKHH